MIFASRTAAKETKSAGTVPSDTMLDQAPPGDSTAGPDRPLSVSATAAPIVTVLLVVGAAVVRAACEDADSHCGESSEKPPSG